VTLSESQQEKLGELQHTMALLEQFAQHNILALYKPYVKQAAFHKAGAFYRERALIAANQVGKTWCAGAEVSTHLTGRYPEGWEGKIISEPNKWWVAGVTGESTRDNPQRILAGVKREYGTGMIPLDAIEDVQLARGVPDSLDSIVVKHESGQVSYVWFKSYEKGREKWQGETLNGGIWFDEEPPLDIYTEGLTRTNTTLAPIMLTFTPLLGHSSVVNRYYMPGIGKGEDRYYINMELEDADHYTPEMRKIIEDQYPDFEIEARTKGIPMLGSGRIFPIIESAIRYTHDQVQGGFPDHFRCLAAVDFGEWDHPTAGVWARYDMDADTVYIHDAYRQNKVTMATHHAAFLARSKPKGYPVAWPHDGHKHDPNSGKPISTLWKKAGLKMLKEHAQHRDGGISVQAGIDILLDRMETGRLKVAAHLNDWFEEFRLYHRKDGRIVKERDDLMDATRYLIMSLDKARRPSSSSSTIVTASSMTDGDFNVLG
tara:strand:+ start:923 stop:2380 length:1458 start_codon:yes stop_codon:yes gene_type:complete